MNKAEQLNEWINQSKHTVFSAARAFFAKAAVKFSDAENGCMVMK